MRNRLCCAPFDAILDSAARLFQQHGYAATTTNRVAELAGVSIGTLYHYVPNKDALLYALAERHLRQSGESPLAELNALCEGPPPLDQTAGRLILAVAEIHRAQPRMHQLLFEQAPRTPEIIARLRQLEQLLAEEVAFHLRRVDPGCPEPDLTALLMVQAVEAQVHGAVLAPPQGRSTDQCVDVVISFWVRSLTRAD
ncbi:TetR/AcrR family transcriptional regulator [Nocardia sp. NPDC051750]|uniref:TetR/AcrR family transcriptional regulator n=1 Tax=Nocardia sp. NPDC051750 TaxID=3364325 RepID=UPI003788F6FA